MHKINIDVIDTGIGCNVLNSELHDPSAIGPVIQTKIYKGQLPFAHCFKKYLDCNGEKNP